MVLFSRLSLADVFGLFDVDAPDVETICEAVWRSTLVDAVSVIESLLSDIVIV